MVKIEKADLGSVLAILLISIFSIRKLLTLEPIVYHDFTGISPFISDVFSVWNFRDLGINSFFIFYDIYSMPFSWIGINVVNNLWLLLPIPLSGITMYLLCRKNSLNCAPSFVAAFFYMFNPAILDRFLSAHVGILVGYALLPLILLFTQLMLERSNPLRFILFLGIIVAFTSNLQSHFLYLSLLMMISYGLMDAAISKSPKKMLSNFVRIAGTVFICVLLMLPIIVHILFYSSYQDAPSLININYVNALSTNTDFINAFRLIGQTGVPFIESIYLEHKSGFDWTVFGFVIPFFAILSLVISEKKHKNLVLNITFLGLMSLLLSTGTKYISGMYEWLYFNFPFFYAFREPSKFSVLVCVLYAILIAVSIDSAKIHLNKYYSKKYIHLAYGLLIVILIISQAIFVWPMFTGDNEIYNHHPKYALSKEYMDAGKWISEQDGFFRVAVLPYDSFIIHTWHFVSNKPIIGMGLADSHLHKYLTYIFDSLEGNELDVFAKSSGFTTTKYVVINNKDSFQNGVTGWDYLPTRYKTSPLELNQRFNQGSSFKKVKSFDGYTIYENLHFKPHISVTPPPILVVGDRSVVTYLSKNSNFSEINTLVYATQLKSWDENIDKFKIIILAADVNELIFASLDEKYTINPYEFADNAGLGDGPKEKIKHQWIRSDIFEYVEGGIISEGALPLDGGYAITRSNTKLDMMYTVPQSDSYGVWAHVLYAPKRGTLNISIDGNNYTISSSASQFEGFRWVEVCKIDMVKGTYTISIENSDGENAVDGIAIIPQNVMDSFREYIDKKLVEKNIIYVSDVRQQQFNNISDKLKIDDTSKVIVTYDYEQITPTKYIVHYNATEPFTLVLGESYHPLWKAEVDGNVIDSMIVNSYSNGFFINEPLSGTATIEFIEQKTIDLVVAISSIVFLIILLFLVKDAFSLFGKNYFHSRRK